MQTSQVSSIGQAQQATVGADAFSKLQTQDFLKLLVTELANQDPLNPMDNSQILQQITQLREIQASDLMTQTLESVLSGQNLATANGLMGRNIFGLSDEGQYVTGRVERVTIDDKKVNAHVGDHVINVRNIAEILPDNGVPEETGEGSPDGADAAALEELLEELLGEEAGNREEDFPVA